MNQFPKSAISRRKHENSRPQIEGVIPFRHKQDEVSKVEQQLMEKAADIRGRKAHIAKLQDELKAAQAEPSPCAVAKSSIWSADLSDDEVRSPYRHSM